MGLFCLYCRYCGKLGTLGNFGHFWASLGILSQLGALWTFWGCFGVFGAILVVLGKLGQLECHLVGCLSSVLYLYICNAANVLFHTMANVPPLGANGPKIKGQMCLFGPLQMC